MGKPPVIELREVSLAFDEKQVLSSISFRVDQGETLFLLGVTGAGKSLLLKLILGLIKPDSGQVLVALFFRKVRSSIRSRCMRMSPTA
jgi:ABC-type transporter Mla maintaining outer membrane lipid asymmetry ATPase subunit MlaF